MLIEFRVENHRSLRDEQVLTMEAGRVGDESDPRPRKVSGYPEKLLTVAGLYGANASGKSNVLAALAFMYGAVLRSHRLWSSDEGIPRDTFAWGQKRTEPSLFEVTLLINGTRFQYGFLTSDECFLEEWLYSWPKGYKQLWFTRENNKFKFGENLKGENKLIEDVTRPNALFLSAAVQHNHPQLRSIFTWFRSIRVINLSVGRYPLVSHRVLTERTLAGLLEEGSSEADKYLSESEEHLYIQQLEQFRVFLSKADVGFVDMDLRVEENILDGKRQRPSRNIYLKHQSEFDDAWLPLKEQSQGTQTLFYITWPMICAFRDGGILLVDELERSLHPYLARQIISQFNDPKTNPNNAQLIFTTHDTNLLGTMLGEPALRRDQVWLTEKNPEGATELYPLTNYKPRKAENIERGYLQGRYGAIPFVGNFSVAGE